MEITSEGAGDATELEVAAADEAKDTDAEAVRLLAEATVEEKTGCEECSLTPTGVEKGSWDEDVLLFKQEQAEETQAIVEPVHWVVYEGRPSVDLTIDFVKLEQNSWP